MDESLLQYLVIFDDSNLIDQIRQTCIDLIVDPVEEDVHCFLSIAEKYLDKEIDLQTANEFFTAIISYFMRFPKELTPSFNELFKKSRSNSNYIILFSSFLSELTQLNTEICIDDYNSFVNDALKEILPQIHDLDDINLNLFGHKIYPQYTNDLILSLLLTSNLTDQIILDYLPFILIQSLDLTNIKANYILQKISKLNSNKILPQTDESINELFEFITQKDFKNISKMCDQAKSFIECAVIYTKSELENEFKIEGLTKEMTLPFVAVLTIYLQKCNVYSKQKPSELILKGIAEIESNSSPIFNASIDSILQSYQFIFDSELITYNAFFQFFEILIKKLIQGEYKANKNILILTIFILSSKIQIESVHNFFNTNGNGIIQFIIENINEINSNDELKQNQLNLNAFDSTLIFNHLQESSSVEDATKTVYFIEKVCCNVPKLNDSFEDLSAILLLFINEIIQEERWDDVLLIGQFMKENGGYNELEDFKEEQMPDYVKESLFGYVPNEQETIDDLLSHILADPQTIRNSISYEILFNKMISDQDILHSYIAYIISRYHDVSLTVHMYLTVFLRTFQMFPNQFIDITNQLYYYNAQEGILLKKPDFKLSSLPISEFGLSIISKLFNAIEKMKQNHVTYQAFKCLKVIANSFPFLFSKNPQQVFDVVLPYLSDYHVLLTKNPTNDQFELMKIVHSSLSFLLSTLQSSIALDTFANWLFNNITSFNDSQILAFVIILRCLYADADVKTYIQAWILKTKFCETLGSLLSRDVNQTAIFRYYYRLNIYNLLEETYQAISDLSKLEIIQVNDLSNVENPFETAFEKYYSTFPCLFVYTNIEFTCFSQQLVEFMRLTDEQRSFYVSFDIQNNYAQNPNIFQTNSFIDKLIKNESVNPDFIPSFNETLTIKQVSFALKQPIFVSDLVINSKKMCLVPEMFEIYLNNVEKLNEIKNESNEDSSLFSLQSQVNDKLSLLYSNQKLFNDLFNEITKDSIEDQNFKNLCNLFIQFANQEVILISLLSLFSDLLKKFYNQHIGCYTDVNFLKSILRIVDVLLKFSKIEAFQNNFIFTCGEELLDVTLSPECRSHLTLILKVSSLFSLLPGNLPIRLTHLIGFLFNFKDQRAIQSALKLSSKFNAQQLANVSNLILDALDKEISEGGISNEFIDLMKCLPSLFASRNYVLLNLLSLLLDDYFNSPDHNSDNDEDFDKISFIFNFIAPKRDVSTNLSIVVEKSSSLPQFIIETSPTFWDIYDQYKQKVIEKVHQNPLFLDKLQFLLNYPELICFNTRSSYFRKKMKKMIDSSRTKLSLNIKTDQLLSTSFAALRNRSPDELLTQFNVVFDGGKTVDHGGPTCDWFTKLAKEIFNSSNGYFQCSEKNISYQPSCSSINKDDCIDFFRFAGQFVARALIEGVCIDAHLTSSLCKLILHREPKLSDLEDTDVELFQSLQWMSENDVNPLEMTFEVFDESGANQTIPLKKNGNEIIVTNENKNEYINLMTKYALKTKIEKQIDAFINGFDSLIPHKDIKIFTPNELDLLICGVPQFDVDDFKAHTVIMRPYTAESPVIKYFFDAISKWDNQDLIKLLQFITGCARVTSNGFKEFCEITGRPITINSGGERKLLPQAHTCANTLSLPNYENEEELNEKLHMAINLCDSFEFI